MSLLRKLSLDRWTPARVWAEMDPASRELAARCLYDPRSEDTVSRAEADVAIAGAIRFRVAAIRKLPVEKRVGYLTRAVRADDGLAGALLRALHLVERPAMLSAFLDQLEIPNENGVIEGEDDLERPTTARLAAATKALRDHYPDDDVDLYLATLLAMDREFWDGLAGVVHVE